MPIQTINPATGKLIKTYPEMSWSEVDRIINAAHDDFLTWRETAFAERAEKLRNVGKELLQNKQQYAALITEEMGKPTKLALGEIEKCARLCEHFAEHAEQYLTPHTVQTEMSKTYVTYQPLGVVFAIMPWNFPFWQALRSAVPILMAGNSCILKHAPTTTGCGLAIEKIFRAAGFFENSFRALIIDTDAAEKVIAHQKIVAVTLTGSVGAGKAVGAAAAGHLKKVVLELGGSDPYLILADADLDLAAEQSVLSRLSNSGQVCIAAKRFIVVDAVREAFEKRVIAKAKEYKVGDPLNAETNLGPLAREDLRETVQQQVEQSITKGAQLIMGGKLPAGEGFFYPVTILKNVTKGMPAYDDEIFGPVISFINVKDTAAAIKVANDTRYGLGAAVFTQDIVCGEEVALQLEAGACNVNALVASDPRVPFGGIKSSGFGRELSAEGIREFTNVKTIAIK